MRRREDEEEMSLNNCLITKFRCGSDDYILLRYTQFVGQSQYTTSIHLITCITRCNIPSCHCRLVCDLYNQLIHTWTVHARRSAVCHFQSVR